MNMTVNTVPVYLKEKGITDWRTATSFQAFLRNFPTSVFNGPALFVGPDIYLRGELDTAFEQWAAGEVCVKQKTGKVVTA